MKPGISISIYVLGCCAVVSLAVWWVMVKALAYWVVVTTGWGPMWK